MDVLLLECCAYRIGTAIGIRGTDRDLICGAVAVTVMVYTILYITAYALDMLAL